jgi:hypothetical protein
MDCDVYLNPYVLVSGSVKSSKEEDKSIPGLHAAELIPLITKICHP